MIDPIDPGSPDAVHLAYRGDNAGICGRSTGVLDSDPGDADCPECDAAYVGIMHADSEREYLAALPAPETLTRWKDRAPADLDRKALPSVFPDAPPVRTHADGSQEYGPYVGGWISGGCA